MDVEINVGSGGIAGKARAVQLTVTDAQAPGVKVPVPMAVCFADLAVACDEIGMYANKRLKSKGSQVRVKQCVPGSSTADDDSGVEVKAPLQNHRYVHARLQPNLDRAINWYPWVGRGAKMLGERLGGFFPFPGPSRAEVEEKIDKLNEQISPLDAKLTDMKSDHETLVENLVELKKEAKALDDAVKALTDEASALDAQAAKEEDKEKAKALEEAAQEKRDEEAIKYEEAADKKEEVAELEYDIADSLEDISELEQQLKPLVDERDNLQANLPDLERTAAADELALIDDDLAELERTTA